MNKNQILWVSIRIIGLLLLVRALYALPGLAMSVYILGFSDISASTGLWTDEVDKMYEAMIVAHKKELISSSVQLVLCGLAGFYMCRKGKPPVSFHTHTERSLATVRSRIDRSQRETLMEHISSADVRVEEPGPEDELNSGVKISCPMCGSAGCDVNDFKHLWRRWKKLYTSVTVAGIAIYAIAGFCGDEYFRGMGQGVILMTLLWGIYCRPPKPIKYVSMKRGR